MMLKYNKYITIAAVLQRLVYLKGYSDYTTGT
jgi:hypothetical protein